MNRIFLGQPPANIKKWIIEHYHITPQQNDELKLVVQTSGSHMKTGIYEATRDDASKPVTIDWGDGTSEQVDGDIN